MPGHTPDRCRCPSLRRSFNHAAWSTPARTSPAMWSRTERFNLWGGTVGYAVSTVSESWTERKCGGRWVVSIPRWTFPVALVVLAAVLGWMGRHYVVTSTPTPTVPDNHGDVSVYTNDPKAAVELSIYPVKNSANETLPEFQWVEFVLHVESRKYPVWWALTLEGDAAPLQRSSPTQASCRCLRASPMRSLSVGPISTMLLRRVSTLPPS
jgi:hypothetical protein